MQGKKANTPVWVLSGIPQVFNSNVQQDTKRSTCEKWFCFFFANLTQLPAFCFFSPSKNLFFNLVDAPNGSDQRHPLEHQLSLQTTKSQGILSLKVFLPFF